MDKLRNVVCNSDRDSAFWYFASISFKDFTLFSRHFETLVAAPGTFWVLSISGNLTNFMTVSASLPLSSEKESSDSTAPGAPDANEAESAFAAGSPWLPLRNIVSIVSMMKVGCQKDKDSRPSPERFNYEVML